MNQMIVSDSVYETNSKGFSNAILTKGTSRLYFSGIVGWDKDYKLTNEKDFQAQVKQIFINLKLLLEKANFNFQNIVRLEVYIISINKDKVKIFTEIIREYFSTEYKPTITLIGVVALATENLDIEIQVTAEQ
jgi:enamine deaminase RidA (YjgF/YER057c/UK114 family)